MKQRNKEVDFAKGIAIIVVVLGHTCQTVRGQYNEFLSEIIQSFQMPFFMFLSGYCACYALPIKNRVTFFYKKFHSIYVPYLSWILLLIMIRCLSSGFQLTPRSLIDEIINSGFWFLRILFYIFILLILEEFVNEQLKSRYPMEVALVISYLGMLAISYFVSKLPGCWNLYKHLFFFVIGIIVHRMRDKNLVTGMLRKVLFGVSVLLYISGFIIMIINKGTIIGKMADYSIAVLGVITLYLGSGFLYNNNKKWCSVVANIGTKTLGIYAFHWCILFSSGYGDLSHYLSWIPYELLVTLIITTIWLIVSYYFTEIILKTKWAKRILLGQIN